MLTYFPISAGRFVEIWAYPGKKPYTGKSDANPEAFIALIPEKNFFPSRSDSVAFLKLILDLSRSMTKPKK